MSAGEVEPFALPSPYQEVQVFLFDQGKGRVTVGYVGSPESLLAAGAATVALLGPGRKGVKRRDADGDPASLKRWAARTGQRVGLWRTKSRAKAIELPGVTEKLLAELQGNEIDGHSGSVVIALTGNELLRRCGVPEKPDRELCREMLLEIGWEAKQARQAAPNEPVPELTRRCLTIAAWVSEEWALSDIPRLVRDHPMTPMLIDRLAFKVYDTIVHGAP